MDLKKMSDDEKLVLCKRYFFLGFALLPFLWLVNAVWFARDAFRREHFAQQKFIKKYVCFSGIGFAVWMLVFLLWQILFQSWRSATASYAADHLSFVFPLGYA